MQHKLSNYHTKDLTSSQKFRAMRHYRYEQTSQRQIMEPTAPYRSNDRQSVFGLFSSSPACRVVANRCICFELLKGKRSHHRKMPHPFDLFSNGVVRLALTADLLLIKCVWFGFVICCPRSLDSARLISKVLEKHRLGKKRHP